MKMPCKECISYAICRIRVREMDSPDLNVLSYMIDCRRIKRYLGYIDSVEFLEVEKDRELKYMKAINEARGIFDLEPIDVNYRTS